MKKVVVLLLSVFVIALLVLVWVLYSKNQKIETQLVQQINNNPAPIDDVIADPYEGMTLESVAQSLPAEYQEDVQFRSCALSSVESCLSQSINQKITEGASSDLCSGLFTESSRSACLANAAITQARSTGDVGVCNDLAAGYKSGCVVEAAVTKGQETKNTDVCNALTEDNERKNCVNVVSYRLAQTTKDAAWCDRITGFEGPDGEIQNFEQDNCKQELTFIKEEEARQQKLEEEFLKEQPAVVEPAVEEAVSEQTVEVTQPLQEEALVEKTKE